MRRIAIIPARAGSKGVPDKNIIDLCGKPLIVYAIEEALKTGLFDRVIVSTDSEKYAAIAEKAGAEAIMRPAELASDTASTYDVIAHVLQNHLTAACDYFVLLQTTSPMRTATHITEACALFEARGEGMEYVVSVKRSEMASQYIFPIEEDNTLKNFHYDLKRGRRQDFEEYCVNGAIYIAEPKTYLQSKTFFGPTALAYKMSDADSVDIDTWLDYDLATLLMKRRNEQT
ncbi:MAG: acylneuraminate cytidylyltransferase family protein [Ruminococcaceae bacterium]|nr:acylneuraminate cytidylyltransferase family protein [Oscillospiraceae bacterium]